MAFEINLEALQPSEHRGRSAAAWSQRPKAVGSESRGEFPAILQREYSLARRATLITVLTLLAMLALAGLTLATLFLRAQVEHSRLSAPTQANVASSTVTAAVCFGGYEVIADLTARLRHWSPGTIRSPCLTAMANWSRSGRPRRVNFPVNLVEVSRLVSSVIDASRCSIHCATMPLAAGPERYWQRWSSTRIKTHCRRQSARS